MLQTEKESCPLAQAWNRARTPEKEPDEGGSPIRSDSLDEGKASCTSSTQSVFVFSGGRREGGCYIPYVLVPGFCVVYTPHVSVPDLSSSYLYTVQVSGSALGMEGQVSVYHHRRQCDGGDGGDGGDELGPCYRCVFPAPLAAEAGRRCSDNGVLGTVPGESEGWENKPGIFQSLTQGEGDRETEKEGKRVRVLTVVLPIVFFSKSLLDPAVPTMLAALTPADAVKPQPFFAPRPFSGVIGCLQATEALKVLGEFGSPLVGRLCTYDAQDGSFYTVRLRPR